MTRHDGPCAASRWIPVLLLLLFLPADSQADPSKNGHAWYLLGRSFHLAGEYEEAIVAWKRADKLGFAPPYTRYNIAAAYARLGSTDEAFDWLSNSLDAGFAEVNLLLLDEDLRSLRSDSRFSSSLLRAIQNASSCANQPEAVDRWVAGPAPEGRAGARFASLSALQQCTDRRSQAGVTKTS